MGLDLVFMGTPEFAVPSMRRLHQSKHTIRAVVTMPDRPRGRGHRVQPSPVAARAEALGLPVLKPERVTDEAFLGRLLSTGADAVVLVAYGKIIPPAILAWPQYGCINLHPSLLPRYRGAAPIHAPLLNGDAVTGVTTMYMDQGLDTGDILLQEEVAIDPDDNAGDLHDRLAEQGASLLSTTLDRLQEGTVTRIPQDERQASYAPKVEKEQVRWDLPAGVVAARIQGLSPFPGAYTFVGKRRLKLLRAVVGPAGAAGAPGDVMSITEEGIEVACGQGSVILLEAQPEGRSPMPAAEFARGYAAQIRAGFA